MTTALGPRQALETAISALDGQRALLGDTVVDTALGPLRDKLAALVAADLPQRQLRHVSVLFLDMVGSTQLSQHLDPEDVQDVLDTALAEFTRTVQRFEGEVLQYAGDNLLAAFGAGGVREDDAERAVRCGLALLDDGRHWAAKVEQRHGHAGFNVRVGIHTGPVLRGGGVDNDNTLRGLAVNVAARMEQAAPPGALRISQDTWALVRGLFDAQLQPPVDVKGHDTPVSSWLVQGAKPRAFALPMRGIEGQETPLVGRSTELAELLSALESIHRQPGARVITLLAEAGMGKSRLLHEFQHQLAAHERDVWLLLARSQPSSGLQPYGLLRDLLARRLGLADSDTAAVARAKLVQGLAPWLDQPDDPPAECLGQLIGLDFSASPAVAAFGQDSHLLRSRGLAALVRYTERLCQRDGSPVVVLLDDLQWSDDASLDALQHWLTQCAHLPLLALLGARPSLLERRPDWGAALPSHHSLVLHALGTAQRQALAQGLLQRLETPSPRLLDLIDDRAEGNPFYAEELVKMLLDRGVITSHGGSWIFHAERLDEHCLPASLTGVLQARIDTLAPAERHALQMASVIGPLFWDQALTALDPQGAAALPVLRRRAMVLAHETSAFEGTTEQAFHHHLLHQVSYQTVLKSERQAAHAQAAAWLTERVGERGDEYLAITAEHHSRAGQAALASEWFERAASMAADRGAAVQALDYQQRAEAHGTAGWPIERLSAGLRRTISACDKVALRERQLTAIDKLLALAEAAQHDRTLSLALADKSLWANRTGRSDEAAALARRGLEVAERCDDAIRAALCRGNLAWLACEQGDLAVAREQCAIALRWAQQAGERAEKPIDVVYVPQVLLVQAAVHRLANEDRQRGAVLAQASALAWALPEPRLHGSCLETMAIYAMDHADWARASEQLRALTKLGVRAGIPMHTATAHRLWCEWHLLHSQWPEAEREGQAAMAAYQQAGAPRETLHALAGLAEALFRAGRHDLAIAQWHAEEQAWRAYGEAPSAYAACLRQSQARLRLQGAAALPDALQAVLAELPLLHSADGTDGLAAVKFAMAARMAAWEVLHAAGHPAAPAVLTLARLATQQALRHIVEPVFRHCARQVLWHADVILACTETGVEPP